MSSRALFRWTAVALMISGLSLPLGLILHPTSPFTPAILAGGRWAAAHLFWWIGGAAGVFGLTGLYLRQRRAVGRTGFVGSVLAIAGSGLIACAMFFEAFIVPSLAARAPELFGSFPTGGGWGGFLAAVLASGALFGLGFLLLGITLLRARAFPAWAILLAILGGIPFGVNFLVPRPIALLAAVLLGAGLLGLGRALWSSVEEPAAGLEGVALAG